MTAHAPKTDSPDRPRGGRPRTRPPEETGGAGVRAWRARLKKNGGGEVSAYLGGEALQALKAMAKPRERGPLIERLILEEFRRRKAGS